MLRSTYSALHVSAMQLLLMIVFSYTLERSSPADLQPAEIFASATEVLEGDTLELKCRFDTSSKGQQHMYLCKNGIGIRMEILTAERDSTFNLLDVKKENSGNYTCVYSTNKQTADTLTGVGKNSIFIQVKDFMMAHIFIKNPYVSEGDNVQVKCTHFKAKIQETLNIYLCKNGIGVRMERGEKEEAIFTLEQFKKEDSGNYSCVYSIKKHLPEDVTSTNFKNSAIIQVTGNSSQNTPSQTWIIWATIPVILLCVLGALSCFYRRCLLPKRQTEATHEPEGIYSEARFVQSNREPEPCNSKTQQTEDVYSKPTFTKAKKKPKSHSRLTEAAQEPEIIYSEARLVQSNREPEPSNSETQQTDEVYSKPTRTKAKKKPKSQTSETQQIDEVYSKLTRTNATGASQQSDVIYSETARSHSKRKPKSSSPAEMEYSSVQHKEKKKRELSPPEDSVFGEFA